jgi:putative transcriptional regulator
MQKGGTLKLGIKTNLSRILGERRITQAELARRTGLQANTINAVYNDEWKQVSRKTIDKICNALDIDLSELFELVRDDEAA